MSFYGLPAGNVAVASGIMMLTGATLIPVVTVCFSFAAELSYPVPESYSIGIMISFAQIFGFLMGLVLSTIASYNPLYGIAIWVGCALIASFFSFFVKQDLKRLENDDVKNSMYIEEAAIKKLSLDLRSQFFSNSNIIGSQNAQDDIL